jgi:hypothetical protein
MQLMLLTFIRFGLVGSSGVGGKFSSIFKLRLSRFGFEPFRQKAQRQYFGKRKTSSNHDKVFP